MRAPQYGFTKGNGMLDPVLGPFLKSRWTGPIPPITYRHVHLGFNLLAPRKAVEYLLDHFTRL